MPKDVDPRTGRSKADTARLKAQIDRRQKDLAASNKRTREMIRLNQTRRNSPWN